MNIVLLESLGIPGELLEELTAPLTAAGHSFTAYERTTDEAKLIEECRDADVLMLANMPLPGSVIRACEHLKYINIAFTGVDHVDMAAAKEKGLAVSNAAGYATQAVAELTIGQMISLLRNVNATECQCRRNGTKNGLVGSELGGRTVGVIGTGAIGQRVAQLCGAFGCRVLGYAPRPKEQAKQWLTYVSLEELLKESDIVALHCPLTGETRGMIGAAELAMMKPGSYLINMARGPVVDSEALAAALNSCHLAGAAVDVFEQEPPIPQQHPLLNARNCRVTPHIGFASQQSMALRARIVFDALNGWLEGREVNRVL
ncbi:MAG: hydroxyacid dehydrogenase [Christensenellaceae bacterium]|nr:hydroxyacid dehydrogenase [Christensenellaceae bacterium]